MNLLDIIKKNHKYLEILYISKLSKKELNSKLNKLLKQKLIFRNYKDEYHVLYESLLYEDINSYYVLEGSSRITVKKKDLNKSIVNDLVRFYIYTDNSINYADIVYISNKTNIVFTSELHFIKKRPYVSYLNDYYLITSNIELNSNYLYRVKANRNLNKILKIEIINKDKNTNYIYEHASKFGFYDEYNFDFDSSLSVDNSYLKDRTSFLDEYVVTIDGSSTLDFDDAFSLTFSNDFYHLHVHIADVSNYVDIDSKIDKIARKKGTSLYLADIVIPMLPKYLSEGLCSLSKGNIRLTLSALIDIDKSGNVVNKRFVLGYIKVSEKLTYEYVNDYYNKKVNIDDQNLKDLLDNAYKLNQILENKYQKSGKLEFNISEYVFAFIDHKPISLKKYNTSYSEKLIENFMVTTNTSVAEYLYSKKINTIYRFHDVPSEDKFFEFLPILKEHVKDLDYSKLNNNLYQKIIKNLKNSPISEILNQELLKTMAKAKYDVSSTSHFGLGLKYYLHFTSPIRRYPDLVVHRCLKQVILNEKPLKMNLDSIASTSSIMEKKALEAEREMFTILSIMYLDAHLDEEFSGFITSIMPYGFFVNVNGIEGLVHISTLNNGLFIKDSNIIKSDVATYKVGDNLNLLITNLDKEKFRIDFLVKGDYNDFLY